jgi:hypothetical protein
MFIRGPTPRSSKAVERFRGSNMSISSINLVLRDAVLRTAPQDEVRGFHLYPPHLISFMAAINESAFGDSEPNLPSVLVGRKVRRHHDARI